MYSSMGQWETSGYMMQCIKDGILAYLAGRYKGDFVGQCASLSALALCMQGACRRIAGMDCAKAALARTMPANRVGSCRGR
jgi:hypothetical protein